MNRLQEIVERLNAVHARMGALRADILVLADVEALDDTQRADWDTLNGEYDTLGAEAVTLEAERVPLQERSDRLNAMRTANLDAVPGDGAAATAAARAAFNVGRTGTVDIYDRAGLRADNPADGTVYRDRAMAAIESWRSAAPEWKESAERLVANADVSRRDRAVADHILTYGHPLYVRAFTKFLKGGPQALSLLDREEAGVFAEASQRAVNEGTAAAGGALVPPFLDPTIILTNAGVVNPYRQLATVKSITTQTWKGVTSAGVSAEWTAEASEMTDASPTFVSPTITPVRADAYIQASFESIEDTDLASDVAMLFGEARDRLEGTAFAVGSGSTQPWGVVTRLAAVTASRTAANTNGSIGTVDIFALDNNLPPRYRANANFTAAKGILNIVRQLATGPSQQQSAFWTDLGGGVPSRLIGYGAYEASGMINALSAATASNDSAIVLGDFKSLFVVDRIGLSVAYNSLVVGANRRPTGEVGWAAFWRVGADVVSNSAFQLLVV